MLTDSQTTKWSEGLRYIQFMKNRAFHSGIKQSPYKAMFGAELKVGLSTTSLPSELLKDIADEDDLRKLFDEHENEGSDGYEDKDGDEDRSGDDDDMDGTSQKNAAQSLEKQAKKMKATSQKSHLPAKVGDNIVIPTPDVDRAKGDLRNVIGVVLKASDDGFYKIGTKHGLLQKLYCRNEFDICAQKFLLEEKVIENIELLLRTAAIKNSVGTGQGFFKCSCQEVYVKSMPLQEK
ncbi:uncharacterized protein LOC126750568 [Anthonomus grandis grandis]|uniref:uncharacterized protein LOC126750568 n=1 Tax=Anthonomus grandis grandis TaxID=2921223 RepID=UPI0021665872|nr:uncharacterized protein LOC126750568 [Anthonomus grandis grandis]